MFVLQPSREFQGWQRRVCVSITFRCVYSSTFVVNFQEDVRIAIPAIVEGVKGRLSYVRKAAIKGVSRLAEQGMC